MKHRNYPTVCCYGNSLHRLCTPMRSNIILRRHSNYKPPVSYPLYRLNPGRVNLRRLFSRQGHPHTILRLPLHPPLYYHRPRASPPSIPTRDRIQQPNRIKLRYRQNPISPLLYNQRPAGGPLLINSSHNFGFIFPRCARRPRQFYSCKSTQHSTTH